MKRWHRSVRNCLYLYPYATLTETQGRPSKLGRPVETGRANERSKDRESNVKPSDYVIGHHINRRYPPTADIERCASWPLMSRKSSELVSCACTFGCGRDST